MRWTVVLPVKALPAAKSRLLPTVADAETHARLVEAFRSDTLRAAQAADGVARVLLVTDQPLGPEPAGELTVLVQSRPGLNGALAEAAEYTAARWPEDGIAALVGDLPALRTTDLAAALTAAAANPRSFVADTAGTGTTMLTVCPGTPLRPRFGPGSAAQHAAEAVAIDAAPGLRCDVDTAEDLAAAAALGVGPATAAALGSRSRFARSL